MSDAQREALINIIREHRIRAWPPEDCEVIAEALLSNQHQVTEDELKSCIYNACTLYTKEGAAHDVARALLQKFNITRKA